MKLRYLVCLLPLACGFAQEEASPPAPRRTFFGVRVEYSKTRGFETFSATGSATKPIADYQYSASTPARGVVVTPTAEYRLKPNLSLGLEFHFLHAEYRQVTTVKSGLVDPTSSTDDRKAATITQTTKASYWELPVVAHYYGLRRHGLLSKSYATAGLTYRHVGTVRTGNEYANADTTTDYNELAVAPDHSNQLGLVAGVGLRFIDAFQIRVAPEVRYTRWLSTTFHGPAFRSAANQLTVGLGFSF